MQKYDMELYTKNFSYEDCLKGPPFDMNSIFPALPVDEEWLEKLKKLCLKESVSLDQLELIFDWSIYFSRVSGSDLITNLEMLTAFQTKDIPRYLKVLKKAQDDAMLMTSIVAKKLWWGRFVRNILPKCIVITLAFSAALLFFLITAPK